jgi:hypothetical protein
MCFPQALLFMTATYNVHAGGNVDQEDPNDQVFACSRQFPSWKGRLARSNGNDLLSTSGPGSQQEDDGDTLESVGKGRQGFVVVAAVNGIAAVAAADDQHDEEDDKGDGHFQDARDELEFSENPVGENVL